MKKVAVLFVALLAAVVVGTALAASVEEAGTAAGTVAVATDAEAVAAASTAAESQAQADATAAAAVQTDAELEAGAETDAELSADAAAEDALDRNGKSRPINCMDAKVRGVLNRAGNTGNGVYWVKPLDGGRGFFIWCDMTTDGGGWNVFSRRFNGETDFYRPWKAYKHGFGSKRGEHWLGLDKIHRLSKTMPHTLRVNLVAFDGTKGYGTWRTFMIDDEEHKYTLTARKFRDFGIGNSLRYHSGRPFSTYDRDNDAWANNCASYFHGAWWYGACHNANLNGKYYPYPGKHPRNYADGADWLTFKGHFESAKRLKMMFK